jgi:hypothetical protein
MGRALPPAGAPGRFARSGVGGEIILQRTAHPRLVAEALDRCLPQLYEDEDAPPLAAIFVTDGSSRIPLLGAARDHLPSGGVAALDDPGEILGPAAWIANGRLIARFAIVHTTWRSGGARADLEFDPDDPSKARLVVVDEDRSGCIALFSDPAAEPYRPRVDPPIPGAAGGEEGGAP